MQPSLYSTGGITPERATSDEAQPCNSAFGQHSFRHVTLPHRYRTDVTTTPTVGPYFVTYTKFTTNTQITVHWRKCMQSRNWRQKLITFCLYYFKTKKELIKIGLASKKVYY